MLSMKMWLHAYTVTLDLSSNSKKQTKPNRRRMCLIFAWFTCILHLALVMSQGKLSTVIIPHPQFDFDSTSQPGGGLNTLTADASVTASVLVAF